MNNHPLGDISLETFLADYWQKKPLLVRQALPDIQPPIAADELAGLACEEEVESRLIVHDAKNDQWDLSNGPFTENAFSNLPETHWTLLVQAVDHWVPAAADFLSQFYFIPSWRVDDLMISYSGDKGGVGPHYDNYDVFLVQMSGCREWQVGGSYNESSAVRPYTPVKILTEWESQQSWILNPGDMLYVPPGIGHNGIALGDECMTCSVGFRAPSHRDILLEYPEHIAEHLSEDLRYADPNLVSQSNPGLISSEALRNVQKILAQYIDDQDRVAQWFGKYMTTTKYPSEDSISENYLLDDLRLHLSAGGMITRNEGSRFAFQERENCIWLFIDGKRTICSKALTGFIETLCIERSFTDCYGISEELDALILELLNCGSLYLS